MPTVAEAAAQIEQIDQQLLEQTARLIYIDLMKGEMRGRDGKAVAQAAYTRAKDFTLVTQALRDGASLPEPQAELKPLFIQVHLWDAEGEYGKPMVDGNGQPIYEVQPVDRDAFAPNLPAGHPINQRYAPIAVRARVRHGGKDVPALCDPAGNPLSEDAYASAIASIKGEVPVFARN
jgi:hypothetical protein